jgi:mRNA interferase MazF
MERDNREIKRGDIFYIDIPKDLNDPHKQVGCRPCIIMSNDMNNKHCSRIQYIPCTSKMSKAKLPTHTLLKSTRMERDTIALCECIDAIDKSFIKEKIGVVSEEDMMNIEIGMAIQLYSNRRMQFVIQNARQYARA